MSEERRGTILGFIAVELLGDGVPPDLDERTPLLSSGLVDSLALEQLLWFVEDEFGVEFAGADLTAENFETVASIEGLLQRKLDATREAAAGQAGP